MKPRKHYFGLIELFVGLAIIGVALVPLSLGFQQEGKCLRGLYYRAVAEQVLDGYQEILVAGEWRKYPMGASAFTPDNQAFNQLPAGLAQLELTKLDNHKIRLVLTWKPNKFNGIGTVRKEAFLNENN